MEKPHIWKDIAMIQSWSFPPSFYKAPDAVSMVRDEPDIAQSVRILLCTTPGERFLVPDYGFDWNDLLFEPVNGLSASIFNPEYLKHRLSSVLDMFEPRVDLEDVQVEAHSHEGKVNLDLVLRVRETGKRLRIIQTIGG